MSTATSDSDTATSSVPSAPASPEAAHRRLARWLWGGTAVVFVVSVIAAALVPVPYYALRPGSARTLEDLIYVDGAEQFPTDSPVAFTTVRVGRATMLEAMLGWVDDDVDMVPEEVIDGGRSEEDIDLYNQRLMDDSKLVATAVALRELGHEVTLRTAGVLVEAVVPGQPAEGALQRGDLILAIDGEALDEPDEIRSLLQAGGPGATHVLSVERAAGQNPIDVELTTAEAPDDPSRAVVGILPRLRIVDIQLPFDLTVDSAEVGGPSAGLAFTLAILDHLTPGELTGGHDVAATGTIDLDGRIGPVGGEVQKAVAVRQEGYDTFLVPSAELETVSAKIGDEVRVIAVDTLDQALDALATLGGDVAALGRPGGEPSS